MKYIIVSFLFLMKALNGNAQKRVIDNSVFDKWPTLERPAINSSGTYVLYTKEKTPSGNHTLVIQSLNTKWKKEIVGGAEAIFSNDGKQMIFKSTGDSLCILQLDTEQYRYFANVKGYKLTQFKNREWIVLEIENSFKELRFHEMQTGIEQSFKNVTSYQFSEFSGMLLFQTEEKIDKETKRTVQWLNLESKKSQIIWQSNSNSEVQSRAANFAFDNNGEQVGFIVFEQKVGSSDRSLWYYKDGMENAELIINLKSPGFPVNSLLAGFKFSQDCKRIFFESYKYVSGEKKESGVNVDIWSYKEDKLQSQQLKEYSNPKRIEGVICLDKREIIVIKDENEYSINTPIGSDNFKLVTVKKCYSEENNIRLSCREPLYLINAKDGSRRLIKDSLISTNSCIVSPRGKFVIYFDHATSSYFCYNIKDGKTINISKNIPFPTYRFDHDFPSKPGPSSVLGNWLPEDNAILIYDQFDIWMVDPTGMLKPKCITNGFGRKNKIVLRLMEEFRVVKETEIMLVGFRHLDKANGLFKINIKTPDKPPILLILGQCLYYWPYIGGMKPLKAANADVWLFQRMIASEAPNYYSTFDFKTLKQLSDEQPHREYNWLKAELHSWKMFDGQTSQGILYKPENFDPRKKYPVILNFYEKKTDELNIYRLPEATGSHINIPHFVSNGYIVFVPDIHFKIGETKSSILNSVLSAVQFLSKMDFIDSFKIGVQGHSFGGYETNVLITNTDKFAAAAEAAGVTNAVSGYGSVGLGGMSFQFKYETGQYRLGKTIWENPNLYIENTPLFKANMVSTPLLIMHCKNDDFVPFGQGLEWFTALRRLNKPVWMLQYDNGGHQLGSDAEDYTIRLKQFFDHFLKNAPTPKWMSRGIPARLKGIETGYAYDPAGNCGKYCKVCKQWNDNYWKDSVACWKEIERRKVAEHWQ